MNKIEKIAEKLDIINKYMYRWPNRTPTDTIIEVPFPSPLGPTRLTGEDVETLIRYIREKE
jgi:hypothetical protein